MSKVRLEHYDQQNSLKEKMSCFYSLELLKHITAGSTYSSQVEFVTNLKKGKLARDETNR